VEREAANVAQMFGLSLPDLGRVTASQYRIMTEAMPEIWARWHLQVAQLEATILNMFGGKPDPAEESKGKGKALPPERMWTAEERLVFFARLSQPTTWTLSALRDAFINSKKLPTWSRHLVPWKRAEEAVRGRAT
jgi:hypothetical protein